MKKRIEVRHICFVFIRYFYLTFKILEQSYRLVDGIHIAEGVRGGGIETLLEYVSMFIIHNRRGIVKTNA